MCNYFRDATKGLPDSQQHLYCASIPICLIFSLIQLIFSAFKLHMSEFKWQWLIFSVNYFLVLKLSDKTKWLKTRHPQIQCQCRWILTIQWHWHWICGWRVFSHFVLSLNFSTKKYVTLKISHCHLNSDICSLKALKISCMRLKIRHTRKNESKTHCKIITPD